MKERWSGRGLIVRYKASGRISCRSRTIRRWCRLIHQLTSPSLKTYWKLMVLMSTPSRLTRPTSLTFRTCPFSRSSRARSCAARYSKQLSRRIPIYAQSLNEQRKPSPCRTTAWTSINIWRAIQLVWYRHCRLQAFDSCPTLVSRELKMKSNHFPSITLWPSKTSTNNKSKSMFHFKTKTSDQV